MIIAGHRIRAERWPWQEGYNWRGQVGGVPLNLPDETGVSARFGGGWRWKLGIAVGGSTIMVDLLFGMITVSKMDRCKECGEYIRGKYGPLKPVVLTNGERCNGWWLHEECYELLKPRRG